MTLTTTAMVPTIPGRPTIAYKDGATVFVCVHDAHFIAEQRKWKTRLAYNHPDAIQSRMQLQLKSSEHQFADMWAKGLSKRKCSLGHGFRETERRYQTWLARERVWYAQFGLEPPLWGKQVTHDSVGVDGDTQIASTAGIAMVFDVGTKTNAAGCPFNHRSRVRTGTLSLKQVNRDTLLGTLSPDRKLAPCDAECQGRLAEW